MKNITYYIIALLCITTVISGCRQGNDTSLHEDKQAKQMMQGVWTDDENDNAIFMAKGDSIFYPDSSSQPAKFWIYGDSLYIKGADINHYLITQQTPHTLKFVNDMGDDVKLVKTDDNSLNGQFSVYRPYAMNVLRRTSTDTLFHSDGSRWEVKISIQPTSDQVIKTDYNDIGIKVDNLYLDNRARVTLLFDGVEVYTHEFQKAEFERFLPKDLYPKSILRDIRLDYADASSVFLAVTVGIPDASSSYVIETRIERNGKIAMRLK